VGKVEGRRRDTVMRLDQARFCFLTGAR
jgi:hypothetical protein